jgi:O-antigen/teichoic acid export membrane protein
MQIGKKDIAWNFIATFMRVASGVIILPLVLRLMPTQEVGLWNVFITVGSLAGLLDFGFSNSFSRNIAYIFAGVKTLRSTGYENVESDDKSIDYGLLKSVISSMKMYYGVISGFFLLVFIVASPFYLTPILQKYSGNHHDIWVSWFIYGVLIAYQLYTYYYNSLLTGRGQIKNVLQITVIGQSSRIVASVICLLLGYGIISLVIGQLVSDIVNRTLCYLIFYDKDTKRNMQVTNKLPVKEVLSIMTPNAVKIGITSIGSFFINKVVMFVAPLYLSLSDVASFGTTKQMIDLIISFGGIWMGTYYPKINLYRVKNDNTGMKRLYLKAKTNMFLSFLICGVGLVVAGPLLLDIIHSKTQLLPTAMIGVFLLISYLDANQGLATTMLLTKNEVPFMQAVLFSGIATVLLLYLSLEFTQFGIWGMIISAGIAQSVYQNWKWPLMVKKDLNIKFGDYIRLVKTFSKKDNQIIR